MINAIKIFIHDLSTPAGYKVVDLVVGQEGITKIFTDREKPNTVVVLCEHEIFEYGNVSYIASKSYKDKPEDEGR